MHHVRRAESLIRATRSLADAALRAAYVESVVRSWPVADLAIVLDRICAKAEQAEAAAREALFAIVDALNADGMDELVQQLREQAAGESLLSLDRLVRSPVHARPSAGPALSARAGILAAPSGRPLTLGERKSLARRPDRDTMERLLSDPHPDVIQRLLGSACVLEDDVIRLAAKRPGRSEVLAQIARSTRWAHRPRVRMALVMNPATPVEIASRVAGLLLRPELERVVRSPAVPAAVRAVCLEHLERRPPVEGRGDDEQVH